MIVAETRGSFQQHTVQNSTETFRQSKEMAGTNQGCICIICMCLSDTLQR